MSEFPYKCSAEMLLGNEYLNHDGSFIRLHSPHKGSDEAGVNSALNAFETSQEPYGYLLNRLRERVSIEAMKLCLYEERVWLSSIVNDVRYGVDAVMQFGSTVYAIDVTCNSNDAGDKISSRKISKDGSIKCKNSKSQIVELPFFVLYISPKLVEDLLNQAEDSINQGIYTSRDSVCDYIRGQTTEHLNQDIFPRKLISLYFPSGFNERSRGDIMQKYNQFMGQFKNPPPSR